MMMMTMMFSVRSTADFLVFFSVTKLCENDF